MDQIAKQTIRDIWYSNKTIDFKLEAEKTICNKETNHSRRGRKIGLIDPYEIRRNLEYVCCVK